MQGFSFGICPGRKQLTYDLVIECDLFGLNLSYGDLTELIQILG